jgi:TPR repeat protein
VKQQITTLFAGGVLALALFGAAMAGPLEDGQAAVRHGDYATAMQYFRVLADQGNAVAQNNLGFMYDQGLGVPRDYAQAGRRSSTAALTISGARKAGNHGG